MKGHFIRTNPIQGLSPGACADAIALLRGQMPDRAALERS